MKKSIKKQAIWSKEELCFILRGKQMLLYGEENICISLQIKCTHETKLKR